MNAKKAHVCWVEEERREVIEGYNMRQPTNPDKPMLRLSIRGIKQMVMGSSDLAEVLLVVLCLLLPLLREAAGADASITCPKVVSGKANSDMYFEVGLTPGSDWTERLSLTVQSAREKVSAKPRHQCGWNTQKNIISDDCSAGASLSVSGSSEQQQQQQQLQQFHFKGKVSPSQGSDYKVRFHDSANHSITCFIQLIVLGAEEAEPKEGYTVAHSPKDDKHEDKVPNCHSTTAFAVAATIMLLVVLGFLLYRHVKNRRNRKRKLNESEQPMQNGNAP